jgi:hypothetical protein
VFEDVTRRLAIADAVVRASSLRAQLYDWSLDDLRTDAMSACGDDADRRRDIDFYLTRGERVQRAWAAVVDASRAARPEER